MPRLFLLFALMIGATELHAEPATFTVMTYNIRGGLGGAKAERNPIEARGRKLDLRPVIAAIRSAKPDVVALQEVVGETQARLIATALGMAHVYARHGDKYGNWWGLAILSRFPIQSHRSDVTSTGHGNSRSDLTATIRVGGRSVTIVDVHPDKDLKDGAPIRRTMARIESIEGPLVLLGDFNARPNAARLAPVRSRLVDAADVATANGAVKKHPTFMRDGHTVAGAHLDYIFIDPKFVDVREVRLLDRSHWPASDHIGVIATMKLKAP